MLTRVGVFAYSNPDGTVRREYRSPEEVFAPEHLASLRGAPVTLEHPTSGHVAADNWRSLTVGHAGDDARRHDDGIHVASTVYVQDAAAVQAATQGSLREISLGYDQDYVADPGETPEGEQYDGRQTKLRVNHVALVSRGRAGRTVGLRLDAAGDEITSGVSVKIKIAGTEYEAGTPEAIKAQVDLERRLDAANGELVEFRKARTARFAATAKAFGVEYRADADDSSIMVETLKKIAPSVSVEGRSPDYIEGAFAAALAFVLDIKAPEKSAAAEDEPVAADGAAAIRADRFDPRTAPTAPSIPPDEIAFLRMVERGSQRLGKV